MPFQAILSYTRPTTTASAIEVGYAWPQHPQDPKNPALWGPPDAPLGHLPYNHPAVRLVTDGDDTMLRQFFAYPDEWYLAQIPARLAAPNAHPVNCEILQILWDAIPPEFRALLQKYRNPRDMEMLKKRLGLESCINPEYITHRELWGTPGHLQKTPSGHPATNYMLTIHRGRNMTEDAYVNAVMNLHTQLTEERQETCRFPYPATPRC